ncbi:MAG: TonB-dependent receptor [Acidobacteria bacterium]|nr:TonB-dependent receptor [Acidobacteriota bacterium]
MKKRNFTNWLMLLILTTRIAWGATSVHLSGEVVDPAGRPIPSAHVHIEGTSQDFSTTFLTPENGRFDLDLPAGHYQLKADHPGFSLVIQNIQLETSTEVEVVLPIASLNERVTVTATRNEQSADKSARITSVLEQDEIRHLQPTHTTELLSGVPGVYLAESGPFRVRPILRGLDSNRVLILVDGQRLNNGRTSTVNAGIEPALVDIHQIEKVEVAKGAGSLLYGSDAMAGVINIITKKPAAGENLRFSNSTISEYQSVRDGLRFHTSIGIAHSAWSLRLGGSLGRFENYKSPSGTVRNSGGDEDNLEAGLSFDLSSRDSIRLQWERRRGSRIGVPGSDESSPFFALFPFDNRDKMAIFIERSLEGEGLQRVQGNFFWQKQKRNFFNLVRSAGFSLSSSTVTDTRTVGFDLQLNHDAGPAHRLTYGGSFYRDTNQDLRVQKVFPGTPRARVSSRAPSVPDSSLSGLGFFLQDEWAVGERLSLNFGIRTDVFHSSSEATDNFEGPSTKPRTDATVTGSAGVVYNLPGNWAFFGRVGRAFREPNLFERFFFGRGSVGGFVVPNPDLQPETAMDSELGIRLRHERVRLTFSYFHNRISNLITSVPGTYLGQATFAGQPVSISDNVDEARIQGVEADLEVWGNLGGQWWMFYARQAAQRGTNLTTREPLPLIVPYVMNAGLRWYFFGGKLVQELQLQSLKGGNRVPMRQAPLSGYTLYHWRSEIRLFDPHGIFKPYPGLPQSASLSLENFTDKLYGPLFNSIPAEGLNVKAQLRWEF